MRMAPEGIDVPPEGPSLKVRVARSMFWITWSRGVLQLLSLVTTLVVARILVPADYGVMALASIWVTSAGLLADMGLGAAIIQFRDLERREIDTCFWITMLLAVVSYAVLSLAAPIIALWFDSPPLAGVLPVVALVLPLTACRVVSDSLLRKRLALDRVAQAEVIGSLVTLPVLLGCALAGMGVWALVVGYLMSPLVRTIATYVFVPWRPGLRLGGKRVREVIGFSLATLGVRMMWVLRESVDELVVGKVTGQVSLGLYTMAKELALMPNHKIATVINMLSSPVMAELQANIDAMRAALYRAVRLSAAIVIPTSAGIALVANEMVPALLGPKWVPAIPILRLLSFYAAVRAIDALLPPVLFARHRERFLLWYTLILLAVVLPAAILGALWDGAAGVVLFSTPVYCVVMVFMAREALAELNGRLTELWLETWPVFAAAAAMAAVVLLTREFALAGQSGSPWPNLIVLSVIGAVTYGATLLAIGSPVIGEGVEVVGWVLKRGHARR